MNIQERIEELIEKLKREVESDKENPNKDMVSWIYQDGVLITTNEAKAILTIIDKQCEHKNIEPKLYNQADGILEPYKKIFDSKCADCGRLISTTYS